MANETRLIDANRTEEKVKISDKPAWMVVRDMPTVDAVEVVHGNWTPLKYPLTRCSVCGVVRNCVYDTGWNYCPNCGADMR